MAPYRGKGNFDVTCGRGEEAIVLARIIPTQGAVEAMLPIPNIKRIS